MNLPAINIDALTEYSKASDMEQLKTLTELFCKQLGFDHFVYALRVPTQLSDARLILIDGYPASWVAHYFAQSYYDADPVMAYCAKNVLPIEWHKLPLDKESASARMMQDAAQFGLKSGVTMPLHGPNGELGILSFSMNRADDAAYAMAKHALPYTQLIAPSLHDAIKRIHGLDGSLDKPKLSKRELECLRWVGDGKSSWEIAHILNLSERTVNFHINNASTKLSATSRQHAATKAVLQHLIRPHPF